MPERFGEVVGGDPATCHIHDKLPYDFRGTILILAADMSSEDNKENKSRSAGNAGIHVGQVVGSDVGQIV